MEAQACGGTKQKTIKSRSNVPQVSDSLEDRKGDPISLIGASGKKHRDRLGAWMDLGKAPSACFSYIIVEKPDPENPETTHLNSVRASRHNIVDEEPVATTYIQAAFQQIPQLGERLDDFARMVAKCRIQKCRELSEKIGGAIDREIRHLMLRGSTAEYRLIDTTGLPNVIDPDDEENLGQQ